MRRFWCSLIGHSFKHGPWTWDGKGDRWLCTSTCQRCGLEMIGPVTAYGKTP